MGFNKPKNNADYGDSRNKKRKSCPFTSGNIREIDYKDIDTLSQFVTDKGKIFPRRITGVSSGNQKKLAIAIKRARHVGRMAFSAEA